MKKIMNNALFALLASASIVVSANGMDAHLAESVIAENNAYEELLQDFKEQLYACQQGLMEKEKYFAFIAQVLNQAEQQLLIPQYFKQNPTSPFAQEYFSCLLNYNICCFHCYINDNTTYRIILCRHYNKLFDIVKKIIAAVKNAPEDVITSLAKKEADNTEQLLSNANRAYYNQLPWRIKLGIKIKVAFFRSFYHCN